MAKQFVVTITSDGRARSVDVGTRELPRVLGELLVGDKAVIERKL